MSEPYIDTAYSELSDEQTAHILEHLARTWKLGACRNCDGTYYQLLSQITLRFSGRIDVIIDSAGHERQCAALVCTTCGEVRAFDLTVASVFDRKPPTPRPGRQAAASAGPYR